MIHSARSLVKPVANIIFTLNLFCFEKSVLLPNDSNTTALHAGTSKYSWNTHI